MRSRNNIALIGAMAMTALQNTHEFTLRNNSMVDLAQIPRSHRKKGKKGKLLRDWE